MKKNVLLLLAMLLFGLGASYAQSRTVTGTVTSSEDGSPLPGVSVMIKGTARGAQTGADGTYRLEGLSGSEVLVFQYLGFNSKEESVGSKSVINVTLRMSESFLDELVVVGYGTQQKTAFTGSASKVDVKQISNLMTASIDKQLSGRATGVQVTNSGGLVNSPARILIRGTNSLTQGTGPLIVVDGIPMISGNLAAVGNSNALGDINPADIESMDILKDGSATAIYGSRAANGVILITTKRGSKGSTRVMYEGFLGFSSPMKKFDLLNAEEFVTISNEKFTNAGQTPRASLNPGVDTDWQAEALINNAPVHSHTLSVQGGNDKTTYYLSLNYSDQKGVIISNFNKAYRVRANLTHDVNKWLKMGNNITLSRQENGDQNNGSNSLSGAIASALRMLPNVSPYNPNHPSGFNINYPNGNSMDPGTNTTSVDDNFTNVAFTTRNNKFRSDLYRIINNTFLEVSPLSNLKVRSQFSFDLFNDYSYQGYSPFHGDGYGTATGGTNGLVYNASQNIIRYAWQNYANYNFSFDNSHNFFLTAGHEIQQDRTKWHAAQGTNISDVFFINENLISGTASVQGISGSISESGFESLFGRINYDFKNKYFLQASVRRDGQSSLASHTRYGVFPGFSAGWRPSQESFWSASEFLNRWIPEAKIKASYAKVGNSLGGFPYLSTYGARPYGNLSGIAVSSIGNPDLRWETSVKYDVGVELGILDNRFSLTADYFVNDVNDLVFNVPTPLSAGVPGNSIAQNIATLQNKGVELMLEGLIMRKKDFSWNFNVNYSNVKNKITSLYSIGGEPVEFIQNGSYNIIQVGEPMNILHGNIWAGVNSANGNPMYYKADGTLIQQNFDRSATGKSIGAYYESTSTSSGEMGAATSLTFEDRKKLGQATPTWFGSFTNNFGYKGFGLEVMLRYSGGNHIMNYTRQDALLSQNFHNNGREILDRWTTPGQITNVPRVYYGQGNNINQSQTANSRFVEKGDYLRLQNVVLSYSLNPSLLTKTAFSSVRLFVQGQNLAVWTPYTGVDPDNISSLGLDQAVSPQVRTISFGVGLGL